MLRWAIVFLVVALIAALFGFTRIASPDDADPWHPGAPTTPRLLKHTKGYQ